MLLSRITSLRTVLVTSFERHGVVKNCNSVYMKIETTYSMDVNFGGVSAKTLMESKRDKASLQLPNWGSLPEELISAILISVDRKLKHCSVTSLFDDQFTNPLSLDYPVEKRNFYFVIVGSVNGLICFRNGLKGDFFLWNPSTRMVKKLPLPIDESESFIYGFGYDEVHDDYKVVGITHTQSVVCSQIYRLRSDSWRELDFQGRVTHCKSDKLVNGKLHWVDGEDPGIISFDLVDEKFGEVVLAPYKEGTESFSLGVLGSNLSMLCNYLRRSPLGITQNALWVMKEYGVKESWTKLYTIIYPDNVTCYVSYPPVFMSSKGESLFVNRTVLRIYNPEDKSFTEVANIYGHLQAQLYIESLVCPFLQNEVTNQ